jgi:hypothetical protein
MVKSWIYFTTGTIMASTFRAMFGPAGFLEIGVGLPSLSSLVRFHAIPEPTE